MATETIWPTKAKIFIPWPFTESLSTLAGYYFLSLSQARLGNSTQPEIAGQCGTAAEAMD